MIPGRHRTGGHLSGRLVLDVANDAKPLRRIEARPGDRHDPAGRTAVASQDNFLALLCATPKLCELALRITDGNFHLGGLWTIQWSK